MNMKDREFMWGIMKNYIPYLPIDEIDVIKGHWCFIEVGGRWKRFSDHIKRVHREPGYN